ncbi:MAG: cytochrome C [Gammaproteobacteria bacterium]|nr:cytochrome C [Gammaproteobacteria bacterium]
MKKVLLLPALLLVLLPALTLMSATAFGKESEESTQSAETDKVTDADCLDCHGVSGYAVPTGKYGHGPKRSLDLNEAALRNSVHGELSCTDCHTDITESPHKRGDALDVKPVDCVTCHLDLRGKERKTKLNMSRTQRRNYVDSVVILNAERYRHSVHADKDKKNNADCAICHTAHYVLPSDDSKSTTYRENAPERCGACHTKSLAAYRNSIHGADLKRAWKGEKKSASCVDCHSSHQIEDSERLSAVRIVTENCGDCHEKETDSYMATTHGQLAWLGNRDVPQCVDCHRGHDTRKKDDPLALISDKNQLETCRECHEDAGAGITQYYSHGNTQDFEKYPFMWLVAKIMIVMVIVVLIFFYSHTLLWLRKEYSMRPIMWKTENSRTFRFRAKRVRHNSGKHFQRFAWQWRVNHWTLVLSVMTLVLTGMAVLYPTTDWAMALVSLFGGPDTFGTIHRTAGVVFIVAVSGHAVLILYNFFVKKRTFDWFGPDSLLPRKKDWEDMKAQFKWFFNKGDEPHFDRWTYWEKFDYWAVYWGAIVIGTSGLMLWFSEELLLFLPGWMFNIAALAHGVEAFLAVMTLFVVHFFNNHFRPSKFPLDTVMFTGSWDLEAFKEERPEHYKRLVESGELEKRLVTPPSDKMNIVWHALGFTLLAAGLILLVLVLIGFNKNGIV